MTDWLSVMERGLKAVRYGIFQASDNLAMLLDGLCRAPEPEVYPRYEMTAPGSFVIPDPAAPPAAVVAPSPKQGSDSPPRDSAIPQAPSGGTQTEPPTVMSQLMQLRNDRDLGWRAALGVAAYKDRLEDLLTDIYETSSASESQLAGDVRGLIDEFYADETEEAQK